MIHKDLIEAFLSTSSVKESLKRSYEEKVAEVIETLASDNPKLKREEVEKQSKLAAVYKVEAMMVCWDSNGNKLAIVTKDGEQDDEG